MRNILNNQNKLCNGINDSAKTILNNNIEKGFNNPNYNIGELLMLITSELGEAVESHRKGKFSDWESFYKDVNEIGEIESFKIHIKDTFEDEIADAVLRLLDLSARLNIDLEKHINSKVEFNKTRPYLHGKNY
jgi:NTP pyrophosphatase (non-canonical NTP hydrolase)